MQIPPNKPSERTDHSTSSLRADPTAQPSVVKHRIWLWKIGRKKNRIESTPHRQSFCHRSGDVETFTMEYDYSICWSIEELERTYFTPISSRKAGDCYLSRVGGRTWYQSFETVESNDFEGIAWLWDVEQDSRSKNNALPEHVDALAILRLGWVDCSALLLSRESIKALIYPLQTTSHQQFQNFQHLNISWIPLKPSHSYIQPQKETPLKKPLSLPTSDNMKIFAIAATALLATVAYASPAPVEARDPTVHVTFIGAAGVTFIQSILPDNTLRAISKYHLFFMQLSPLVSISITLTFDPVYSQHPQCLQNLCSCRLHLHFLWHRPQRYHCCGSGHRGCSASTNSSKRPMPLYLGNITDPDAPSPSVRFTRMLRRWSQGENIDAAFILGLKAGVC